jgi:hypothetical protein
MMVVIPTVADPPPTGPDGTAVPDVAIDYMFTDVPVELSDDIDRYP